MKQAIIVLILFFSQNVFSNTLSINNSVEIEKHLSSMLPGDITRSGKINGSKCTVVFRTDPVNHQSPQKYNDFTLSILMNDGKTTTFYGDWRNSSHSEGSFLNYNKNFILYSQSCYPKINCYSPENPSGQFSGTFSIYTTKTSSIFSVRNNNDGKLWICEIEPVVSLQN